MKYAKRMRTFSYIYAQYSFTFPMSSAYHMSSALVGSIIVLALLSALVKSMAKDAKKCLRFSNII